ncbi:MAG: glycine cleavage system aminomethyltransferase GcvT [Pseudomonadota bacterium]
MMTLSLLTLPLDALHRELDAKMVAFAGYSMPIQYPSGIIKEHTHTREAAGLFDVSHMGQLIISGSGSQAMLESLVPVDIEALSLHHQTYALLTNEAGGVLDDLIVARWGPEEFFLVVNAARKEQDIAHLRAHAKSVRLRVLEEQTLLALQGPMAREVMAKICPEAASLRFMQGMNTSLEGTDVYISASGYTGEDGFEISIPSQAAESVARLLLSSESVSPVGLGARDSLRLEAGLCLYGHELTEQINPIEAGLTWSISRSRRQDGMKPGGFPGDAAIFESLKGGVERRRVGLTVLGKRPVREGMSVLNSEGSEVGTICSACYGATVGGPIAMAYVQDAYSGLDTLLQVDVRGKSVAVQVSKMPFTPQRYHRG